MVSSVQMNSMVDDSLIEVRKLIVPFISIDSPLRTFYPDSFLYVASSLLTFSVYDFCVIPVNFMILCISMICQCWFVYGILGEFSLASGELWCWIVGDVCLMFKIKGEFSTCSGRDQEEVGGNWKQSWISKREGLRKKNSGRSRK